MSLIFTNYVTMFEIYKRIQTRENHLNGFIHESSTNEDKMVQCYFDDFCGNLQNIPLNEITSYFDSFNSFIINKNIIENCFENTEIQHSQLLVNFIDANFQFLTETNDKIEKLLIFVSNVSYSCQNFSYSFINSLCFNHLKTFYQTPFQKHVLYILKSLFLDLNQTERENILSFFELSFLLINIKEDNIDVLLVFLDTVVTFPSAQIASIYSILRFANEHFLSYPNEVLKIYRKILYFQNIINGYNFDLVNDLLINNPNVSIKISALDFISSCYRRGIRCLQADINYLLNIAIYSNFCNQRPIESNSTEFGSGSGNFETLNIDIQNSASNAIRRICDADKEICLSLDIIKLIENYEMMILRQKVILGYPICEYLKYIDTSHLQVLIENHINIFMIMKIMLETEIESLTQRVFIILDIIFQKCSTIPNYIGHCSATFLSEFPNDSFLFYTTLENEGLSEIGNEFFRKWVYTHKKEL
ncbi:hypothetical protein TRFO_35806 [Tritrichomonas foetus]|uniref:Uncharacterized protein n=1 Tax=Tritrichomonas foetus TaxID=1144522 RepID=A0A1J4JGU2_9EUKA|nr:hypothetical protein TRFO_35806 [Tritrichomonas foetus]|eukprot:OHS97897.1 hypothetical protein TRFO_35806 [Tritrichomonas foetus]